MSVEYMEVTAHNSCGRNGRKRLLAQNLKLIMISEDFPNDVEELTINLKLI